MNSLFSLRGALVALALSATAAVAGPVAPSADVPDPVVRVDGNCNAIAQQMAAQYGGRARASLQDRGGQKVCVVVIVVEGKDGQRGERIEQVVPLD
jgi:hypothetical protein